MIKFILVLIVGISIGIYLDGITIPEIEEEIDEEDIVKK